MPPPPPLTDALVREAESLLLGLLRNDLIGVYVIQDHVIRYANRRFAEMFGYTPNDISNQPALEQFVAPHDRERVLANVARRIRGEASTAHYTFRGKHRDGRTLEMEVFGNRTQLEGRPAIIGLMLDITARKAAEQTTVEQLHFIGQLLEAIPSPVFFKDDQARYLGCNKAFETYIGRQRGELIGRSVFDISPPELAARYHEADQQLFDHPGVQTYEASVESTDGMRKEVIFNKATWLRSDGSVGGLVGVITDITDRKQTEALIWMQANYDPLTGLPNRRLLNDRLAEQIKRAQRDQGSLAVLFIDLDRFKEVNDALGHEAGDQLLMEAARRVVGCVRGTDTVARQGGDEFTVLLPDINQPEDAEVIARKVLDALATPVRLSQGEFRATVSVGIALFPRDGTTAEDLTRHADAAMYQVKRSGKNAFRFFDPELNSRHRDRIALENDLRGALARGELDLHYQPQVSLNTRDIVGLEALLRWNHPGLGAIPPATFIQVAEEVGLIGEISNWVLETACAQLAHWQADGVSAPRVSINLSACDFQRGDVVGKIRSCLGRHGIAPEYLEVEITESLMMDDTADVAAKVRALREAGISVAIDDFGTGYSALAYLQRFPVSTLKIDRSFVRDLEGPMTNPIISAITGIARGFELDLVAEGVENLEQADALRALGCEVMQGYLFARPAPADEVLGWLRHPERLFLGAGSAGLRGAQA